jgi:hypothetical protein
MDRLTAMAPLEGEVKDQNDKKVSEWKAWH